MKLFVWKPDGHGQETVMVVEETEEKAFAIASAFVKDQTEKGYGAFFDNWGTKYYTLTIVEPGTVYTHDND